ncbi:MAG: MFS transporter [Kiritimatiellae bacterium]|nr:MFS transporter [Kiritimatiellia bacterium]
MSRTEGSGARRAAVFAVARWLAMHDFPANLLPSGPDRPFVQDLVYTVIRRLRPLRSALGGCLSRWPKGELEALLYVGAAQVLYMPEVPDYAAVNETVEAAKACPNRSVAKVVNGALHTLIRRRDAVLAEIAASPLEERESFPTVLARRWAERFGADDAERLCRFFNEPAETFLARRDGSFASLARGERVEDAPGYAEGEFIVQDPGTALAVGLLAPQPGDVVLDACAAPGGKTVQIAWRGASVTACEVNPARRRRLAENLRRVGLEGAVPVVASLDECKGGFGKILVDAPCSNTGVFRRRPDARWNWSPEKLVSLVRLQAEILDLAAARLAPGGLLVYSTCSLEPEENDGQAKAFLARHPEFVLEASAESLPFKTGHDGAYAAALRMKAGAGA